MNPECPLIKSLNYIPGARARAGLSTGDLGSLSQSLDKGHDYTEHLLSKEQLKQLAKLVEDIDDEDCEEDVEANLGLTLAVVARK